MNMTQEDKTEVDHFIRQTGLSLFSSFTELWSSFLIRSMRLGQSQKTECQTWHATLHGCMSVALLCQFPLLNWLKHLKLSHNSRNERQDKTVRVRQHRRSMAPSLSVFYRLSQVFLSLSLLQQVLPILQLKQFYLLTLQDKTVSVRYDIYNVYYTYSRQVQHGPQSVCIQSPFSSLSYFLSYSSNSCLFLTAVVTPNSNIANIVKLQFIWIHLNSSQFI